MRSSLQSVVSIHAPWEGCDGTAQHPSHNRSKFQFTHPGKGATIALTPSVSWLTSFNSRTLGRVRRSRKVSEIVRKQFQFTHPGKGATDIPSRSLLILSFQFTHPGKGATSTPRRSYPATPVSIHAPWEGCDKVLPVVSMVTS